MQAGSRYAVAVVAVFAATLALHAASSGQLDFFRDELYFVVCGGVPQWGYVDQPPLVPLFAHLSYVASHADPGWFRTIPALAHAGTAALAMLLARVLGGRTYAAVLAGVAVAVAPVLAAFGWLFTTNVFDPLAWTAVILGVACVARSGDERWWLLSGIALGVALEAKYGLAFYVPGLLAGVLLSPLRTALLRPWFWSAAALAVAIALPSFLWQAGHQFPIVELLVNGAREGKNVPVAPPRFVAGALLDVAPAGGLLALAGLIWLALSRQRKFRFVAVGWLVTLALMLALHAKVYYLAAAEPPLIAAGAVAFSAVVRDAIARGFGLVFVAATVAVLPLAIPLYGIGGQLAVVGALHMRPQPSEAVQQSRLTQDFAETMGWRSFAREVAKAAARPDTGAPAPAVVVTTNYGEASALRLFATLPPGVAVLSTQNQYWLWGYGAWDGQAALFIRQDVADLKRDFESVRDLGPAGFAADALPYERRKRIFLCRRLRGSVDAFWRREKNYI